LTTAYITDTRVLAHDLRGHVETAARLKAIHQRFQESGLNARFKHLTPDPISDAQILAVHTEDYLENILKWTESQTGVMLGADTYALPESFFAARLSAGGNLRAVDEVLSGGADNALVALRPPGHHAVPDMAMGFCLLANISLAARHAQAQYGLKRIMIVDFDVHHGNGTQDVFYEDGQVLFLSTHQSPLYPYTGAARDTGSGEGQGTTVNIPLPAGVGDAGFAALFNEIAWPAARRFKPELILVSAGFDAHHADPLGGLKLSCAGYHQLASTLLQIAAELCRGRIVFALEGGYDLVALSHSMQNVALALLGDPPAADPLGLYDRPEASVHSIIQNVCAIHGL
jgi:acetoin utilization deacetylase AcuC-like enzyme